MTDLIFYAAFLIAGLIAGMGAGLLGIGGGVIFIPALLLMLPMFDVGENLLVYTTIATSLFASSFASFGSCFNHFKKKNIEFKFGLLLASGSVITAFVLPRFVVEIDAAMLKYIVAVILFFITLKFLFESKDSDGSQFELNKLFLFPSGLIVGAISAFTGIGGGVIIMPLLHYLFALPLKRAVGTSSFVVAITVIFSTIGFAVINHSIETEHASLGFINLQAGLMMGIGALIGSYFGVKMIFKFKSELVKKIFAVFLILAIVKIIF